MPTLFELMRPPTGATADSVMRQAKTSPLDELFMLGGEGMRTSDIGEVGDMPPIDEMGSVAALDPLEAPLFAPPMGDMPRPATPQLPMPASVQAAQPPVQPPVPAQQPSASGGGLPVQPAGGTPAVQPAAAPPAAAPQANALSAFRQQKRQLMTQMAGKMMEGSPAMRVQGLQLLFEVQKDYEGEVAEQQKRAEAEREQQRQLQAIDMSVADDEDKKRAQTLVKLGGRPQDVAEALQFNNQGATKRTERREQFTKWGQQVSTAARDLGTMEVQQQKAEKLLDESLMTTGTKGWLAQLVPGSAANQLNAVLDPIRALTGYGYLQEMREASKTGGAIGNVTENETRWLMGIQGGLDPVTNDPQSLKENVRTIVEGKRIVLEMRKLAPALDAGDPAAWEKYAELTEKLASNGANVRARMKLENDHRVLEPTVQGSEFEKQYGGR